MAEIKLKYNINYQIGLLPREVSIGEIVSSLEKAGINRDAFYRDRSIGISDEQDIPGERLLIYSKFFGVPLIDLFNHNPKVKAFTQRKPSKTMSKVLARAGLKKV
jgi:hypothetical protein